MLPKKYKKSKATPLHDTELSVKIKFENFI